ncbi:MAG: Gfo/Idh/MocA family protein, partial [Candidatus Zixiibacteriota bacterium]
MLRVGVIGCGYWGPNLVRNFAHCDGVEVLSVCDTDQSRLSFISKQYPSVKLTTDARSVFQDPAVDAVAVATPISTH